MIRVVLFLVVVAVLGFGFGWLADRPGELVFTFAGERHNVSLMVAASMVVAAIASVMLLWWIVKNLIRSPYLLQRHFRARKRDRGYQSLSTGLIAAGAGDAEAARRLSKQAAKLLRVDQEPLIRLLDVQTALLEGRKQDVRQHFEAMIADPETKLLGLRGLYLEACREGAREAAFQYAQEASNNAPQLEWAADAVLGHQVLQGDVASALQVLDARKAVIPYGKDGKTARETLKKHRAVLLTAQAMQNFDADAAGARAAAMEAHKLEPEFIPAAVIAGRCLLRDGSIRKGNRILEAAWRREPHPEIAESYIHGRAGDTALDRLKKARHLAGLRTNNAESAYIVAQAALDAGELTLARESAQAALKLNPRKSTYLLMADIEEAQTADQGRVREWLARAVSAPRDPAWTADGVISSQWAPVSPVTGRINAFEWKVPLTEIAAEGSPVLDADDLRQDEADEPAAVLAVVAQPVTDEIVPDAVVLPASEQEKPTEDTQIKQSKADQQPAKVTIFSAAGEDPAAKPDQNKQAESNVQKDEAHRLVVDDPGVNPDTEMPENNTKIFRLF